MPTTCVTGPSRSGAAGLLNAIKSSPIVGVTPQTTDPDEATTWFTRYEGAGLDGVVAKNPAGAYEPGERRWTKIKHLRTVDCVVGGYRVAKDGKGIGSLLLGLYDSEGALHHVGHTSSFDAAERRAILEQFQPLVGGDSFGHGRTPGGPSRWQSAADSSYTSVSPELVCEVSFDHLQSGRFRHASRFLRWRPDKAPRSCDFDQLSPPEEFALKNILVTRGD